MTNAMWDPEWDPETEKKKQLYMNGKTDEIQIKSGVNIYLVSMLIS